MSNSSQKKKKSQQQTSGSKAAYEAQKQQKAAAKSQAKPQTQHKKRGTWLTIALAWALFDSVLSLILLLSYRKQTIEPDAPWLLAGAILVTGVGVGSVIAMWFWKRWGLYLYVATVLASVGLGLIVFPSLFTAFHALIPLLILAAALSVDQKLALFE
jgi:cation transport ATPase